MYFKPQSLLRSRRVHLAASVVAGIYALLGAGWIVGSDNVVGHLFTDPDTIAHVQSYKGIAFVAVTAALLYGVLVRVYARLVSSEKREREIEGKVIDLFEQHPTPMGVYDLETLQLLALNTAGQQRYGYTESEVLGQSVLLFTHPQEREAREQSLRGLKTGESFGNAGRWRHITRTGETIYVQISASRIVYGGRDAGLVMAADVTADVRSQLELQRQEERFRQLHDSLSDVLWLISPDRQQVLYMSPSCERLYGYSPKEFQANPRLWLDLVVEDDKHLAQAGSGRMVAGEASSAEYRVRRSDGQIRWVLDRKRCILNEDGSVAMFGGIVQDVTEAKLANRRLKELNETLERRVLERTSELVEANAGLESFSRTVAHDLKSPLNGIVGMLDILVERRSDDNDLCRLLRMMAKSGREMGHLVDDLLTLSRASLVELQRRPVDLADEAEQVIESLRRSEPHRDVVVSIQRPLIVDADLGMLKSLLQNLIGNAWKYSAKQPTAAIEIGVRNEDCDLTPVFYVRDNGAGFPIERAGKLFEPFQRFHSSAEFTGTGVGLATCQRIARRHGGDIWAKSQVGAGSTFYFTLAHSSSSDAPPDYIDVPSSPVPFI